MTKQLTDIINNFGFVQSHVNINEEKLYQLSDILKQYNPPSFSKNHKNLRFEIYKCILDSSLQFCFWYGNSSVRVNGNASGEITRLVNEYAYDLELLKKHIRLSRMPLIEERIKIIDEIGPINTNKMRKIISIIAKVKEVDAILALLIGEFTSFADDILMKKALLAVIAIHLRTNIIKDPEKLLIPADYQIPKMLRHFGVLEYSNELEFIVDNDIIIPKNSEHELAIRVQAIKACEWISRITKLDPYVIDQALFSLRKGSIMKHHLTITTSY